MITHIATPNIAPTFAYLDAFPVRFIDDSTRRAAPVPRVVLHLPGVLPRDNRRPITVVVRETDPRAGGAGVAIRPVAIAVQVDRIAVVVGDAETAAGVHLRCRVVIETPAAV